MRSYLGILGSAALLCVACNPTGGAGDAEEEEGHPDLQDDECSEDVCFSQALKLGSGLDAVGDFDGDGHADIVWIDIEGTVFALWGNGDGTFQEASHAGLYDPPGGRGGLQVLSSGGRDTLFGHGLREEELVARFTVSDQRTWSVDIKGTTDDGVHSAVATNRTADAPPMIWAVRGAAIVAAPFEGESLSFTEIDQFDSCGVTTIVPIPPTEVGVLALGGGCNNPPDFPPAWAYAPDTQPQQVGEFARGLGPASQLRKFDGASVAAIATLEPNFVFFADSGIELVDYGILCPECEWLSTPVEVTLPSGQALATGTATGNGFPMVLFEGNASELTLLSSNIEGGPLSSADFNEDGLDDLIASTAQGKFMFIQEQP